MATSSLRILILSLLLADIGFLSACGEGAGSCNSSNCDGCCQGDFCQPGSEASACGLSGAQCSDCAAQGLGCYSGQCTPGACRAKGESCGSPANCCGDSVCRAGQCVAPSGACTSDAQCDQESETCDTAKGTCVCKGGFTRCGAICSDLATDPSHCGSCGASCTLPNAVAGCAAQKCTVASCSPGFFDGDGDRANGCETTCQGLSLTSSGSLDFDLKTITLSGKVTLAGGTAPAGNPRGTLSFALAGTKKVVSVDLPTSGAATYSVQLFAGTYTIRYDKAADCRAAAMPCGSQELKKSIALTSSGSLDLDVQRTASSQTITVSGEVTVNGMAMASSTSTRGQIVFQPAGATSGLNKSLGASGKATYSITLSPGTYDVAIDTGWQCPAQGPLPCQKSIRMRGLSLTSSGSLNVDLPVVTLSGNVTVNGSAMSANSPSRGSLIVADDDGFGPVLDLGTSGAASYRTLLYTGTHTFTVSNLQQPCAGPVPCMSRQVLGTTPVSTGGALDLDLKVVQITGSVKANGQALGASSSGNPRGTLAFNEGAARRAVDLGSSGAASYKVQLYAGTYDLSLENSFDCPNGPLPCGSYTVQKGVTLTASGAYDLDAPVAKVSGAVTVNGAAMATSPSGSSRGRLTFDGPSTVAVDIPSSGSARYSATVYAGTHAISFSNSNDCPTGPAPCQKYVVNPAQAISGSGSLAIDLPVGELSGVVTANGAAIGASATGGARGLVIFVEPKLGAVGDDLGTSGAVRYKVRLYPGSYQVTFSNSTDCPSTGDEPLPCQGGAVVMPTLQVPPGPGAANLDLKIVTLSGKVTVNGRPMPDSLNGNPRGELDFGLQPDGAPLQFFFEASGAALYQTRLLQGSYDIGFKNDSDCPDGAVPCQHQILSGCRVP